MYMKEDSIYKNNYCIKILTDLRIKQSIIWGEATKHVSELYSSRILKRFRKTFKSPTRLKSVFYFIIFIKNLKNYDILITANIFTAQLLALYRKLFRVVKPAQIILELMLDDECKTILWQIKKKIQSYIFSCVEVIFVSSSEETITYSERLSIEKDRIKFLPFHTNIVEPEIFENFDSFILSAGRTGRDYKTLIKAVEDLPVKVKIISDEYSVEGLILPKNVKLLVNVSYDEYLADLKKCRFVIIPLFKVTKSTGQVVFLEAMSFGKPVIASEVVGTKDYIKDLENGILVPPQNIERLKSAILTLIGDKELHRMLATNGFKKIIREHTFERYVSEILNVSHIACEKKAKL